MILINCLFVFCIPELIPALNLNYGGVTCKIPVAYEL